MSLSAKKRKQSCVTFLFIGSAFTMAGCSTASMPPLNPLIQASCPKLVKLNDRTFEATTEKLIEVAGQYNKCRAGALGNYRVEDKAK